MELERAGRDTGALARTCNPRRTSDWLGLNHTPGEGGCEMEKKWVDPQLVVLTSVAEAAEGENAGEDGLERQSGPI